MNYLITLSNDLAPLASTLTAMVNARGVPSPERFELEDTVLRAGGYAWDIGEAAIPLHAQIDAILAAKKQADDAEAARIAALPPEPPKPWRVSKDTLISRIVGAGVLPQVMAILASQPADKQFIFEHSAWFWSNNEELRGMATALGADADALMAPDPFLM